MTNVERARTPIDWKDSALAGRPWFRWPPSSLARNPMAAKFGRYGLAVMAPASVAAVQLLLQLIVLHQVPASQFGLYAFLMVIVQLGYGVSNALICTPFTVLLHRAGDESFDPRSFFTINFVYAALFSLVCMVIGKMFSPDTWIVMFALYSGLAMLRWFGRAYAYSNFRQFGAAGSDLIYAASLAAGLGILYASNHLDLLYLSAALLLSTVLGMAFIGRDFLKQQFFLSPTASLASYSQVWREQSRWALLGVATTEATSNSHSYLVTAIAGPAAFAPLAAASIFMKPVALAITSLTQLERPAMSKALANGESKAANIVRKDFLGALAFIWLAVSTLAAMLLWLKPGIIAHQGYSLFDLRLAAVLLAAIALVQVWQSPNSVFLQAAKEFRVLSTFSVKACLFSLPLVAIAIPMFGPVYSLFGILAGQAMMAVQISRQVKSWSLKNE
jgi:O-antigen/teichoic acid export membrane protein